jgi:hypothetical protein
MRRRRKITGFEQLIEMPWWVSIAIAVVCYGVLMWMTPNMFATSSLLQGLIPVISGLAWIIVGLFLFIAVYSWCGDYLDKEDT